MKKMVFSVLIFVLLFVSCSLVSATPPNENYQLLFQDEFDNGMDLTKWHYRTGERLGGYNYPENVTFKDGKMYHQMRFDMKDGTEQLTGGGIISNEFFGYGYYETKSKLFGETGGMHSSFWILGLYGDGKTTPRYNQVYEIDGYEIDSDRKERITCNINTNIGAKTGYWYTPVSDFPTDTEFTFGFEWLPTEVNWYLNGKKIMTKTINDLPIHYAQQNLWITGLANGDISGSIDRSKLPGDACWEYVRFYAMPLKGVNVIGASEFEYNKNPDYIVSYDLQYPMAWMESGDDKASYVENHKSAVGGNHVLTHLYNKPYKVTTFQRLYYIPNGNYTFTVYASSSGGQKTAKIRISDFDGETVKEIDIPKSQTMTELTLSDIEIKDNGALIEIISDAGSGQWIRIDNPCLAITEGVEVEKAVPYVTKLPDYTPGETVVRVGDKGYSETGKWQDSSLVGYSNAKTRFAYEEDGEASATFEMVVPEAGEYDIRFYKIARQYSAPKSHVYYTVNGKTVEKSVDLTQKGGWEILGTETLKKGDKVQVTIDSKNGGLLRADAASIALPGSIPLKDMLLFEIGSPNMWNKGEKQLADAANPTIAPKVLGGRTYVPIRCIAEALGATINYIDETEEIVIEQGKNTVILKVNSSIMQINGKQILLDAPAYVEDGRTFVPVRAVSEGLNKKVTWVPDKFVVIADTEVATTPQYAKILENLGK